MIWLVKFDIIPHTYVQAIEIATNKSGKAFTKEEEKRRVIEVNTCIKLISPHMINSILSYVKEIKIVELYTFCVYRQ